MKKVIAAIALITAIMPLAGCTREDNEPAETNISGMEIITDSPEDDDLDWGELVPAE